jgi:hypothetical protein
VAGLCWQSTVFRNLSYPDIAKHERENKEVSAQVHII